MKSENILPEWTYHGCGFPIILKNVPTKMFRGNFEPVVDYAALEAEVALHLCTKETPLTGNQVGFLRVYFQISLREFASHLGLSHQAVMKWEDYKDEYARISPSIEKAIRLDFLFQMGLSPKKFHDLYGRLQALPKILQNFEGPKEKILQIAV